MTADARRAAMPLDPWQDPDAVPYVRIDTVTKTFDDVYAVDDVSVDIYKGEFFALLGASGCGKTTLLRMLAGFETPTSGRVWIDGQDMTEVAPHRRPVNMMFQSYALFPHMTVASNVAFGLRQDGLPRDEIRHRVEEALTLVKMEKLGGRKPHQLSGGQRQRVALARSLVKRPKLLLLDEPLAALDKKLREQTQFELVNIQESVGVTFVMVTHDQEEAMSMSTRIAVMDHGRIVQVGPPSEIYEYPRSRFVADFIGSVNLFDGRVVEDREADTVLDVPPLGCSVVVDSAESLPVGKPIAVAIRPEKISLALAEETNDSALAPNAVVGTVEEIAYLGDHSVYVIRLASGAAVRVTAPNVARRAEMPIRWEDRVRLTWRSGAGVVLAE